MGIVEISSVFLLHAIYFPRRRTRNRPAKVEKAPTTSSTLKRNASAVRSNGMAGTAGVDGQRRRRKTHAIDWRKPASRRPPGTNRRENALAGRVNVAASGASNRRREFSDRRSAQPNSRPPSGNGGSSASDPRNRAGDSETPRPSSRETAKPPRWVSGAGDNRHQPSVQKGSPLTFCAERTEAGPGRELTCHQNRFDTIKRPCGEVATHFMGVVVLWIQYLAHRGDAENAENSISNFKSGIPNLHSFLQLIYSLCDLRVSAVIDLTPPSLPSLRQA
jgi:hypothetical protein